MPGAVLRLDFCEALSQRRAHPMESGDEPSSHRLREDVTERLIRERLRRPLIPLAVLVPVVVIPVSLLLRTPDDGLLLSVVPVAVTLAMTAAIGLVTYRRNLARELDSARSYRLALSANVVRRVVVGVAVVEVLRSEVTRIVAVPGQGLYVHTIDPLRYVFIPEQLERFEEVLAELGQWAPIQPPDRRKTRLAQGFGVLWGLVIMGAWIASSWASDPRALAASLCVLYAGVAHIGWSTVRNPNLTKRQKTTVVIVFGMIALGPLARCALVQTGGAP